MCGRFALQGTMEELLALLGVIDVDMFAARYNIAPTQPILVVSSGHPREPGSNLPDRRSLLVRWGLIPAWAKDPKAMPPLFNARAETAVEKAAFKAAMRHRRVLVPASGFYEWRRDKGKTGQAYWIRPKKGGLIAFAGLYETYAEPGGSEIDTGTILTTNANAALASINHRMPVVIEPENFDRWLDCRTQEPRDVMDLLRPAAPDFFEAVPVSDRVNSVANIGPEIQERVEAAIAGDQTQPKRAPAAADQLNLF